MSSLRAKKSLGQHFLRSKTALRQIIDAGNLSTHETVLEIGPGEGALTEALLNTGVRVIAVETDARCITLLHDRFADAISAKRLHIIEGDIRNGRTQKKLFHKKFLGNMPYKLIANIPYYITGILFRLFLETLRQPEHIVFLVQKEVAQLIVARDGKEGILSLAVKAYGDPHIVAKVKREAFTPAPNVDSAIIAIEHISRKKFGTLSDEAYFRVVKTGLASKRKMLLPNLARGLNIPKEHLRVVFKKLSIDENTRGEDLSVEKWIALASMLNIRKAL